MNADLKRWAEDEARRAIGSAEEKRVDRHIVRCPTCDGRGVLPTSPAGGPTFAARGGAA